MIYKIYHNDESTPYEKILDLIHIAFKERLDENIRFVCATYSIEDLKESTKNGTIITLWENEVIVGCVTLNLKQKKGVKYGSQDYLAVHPSYKRKGIGLMLLNKLVEIASAYKLPFITSTTSEKAISSVNWHEKNGFRKFLYASYSNTNYYSYWFVKPLRRHSWLCLALLCRIPLYCISYIICKIRKDENGRKRF